MPATERTERFLLIAIIIGFGIFFAATTLAQWSGQIQYLACR